MTRDQRNHPSRHHRELLEQIERDGFAATNVLGTQVRPDFSYTTGFLLAGHPELLVMGPVPLGVHLFHHLISEVQAGESRAIGRDALNEICGVPVRLLPVPAEHWQEGNHLMLGFPFFYGDDPPHVGGERVLQLVIADGDGRFPWDDDVDPVSRRDQPVLALGDRPVRRPALAEPPDNQHLCACCRLEAGWHNRASRRRGRR